MKVVIIKGKESKWTAVSQEEAFAASQEVEKLPEVGACTSCGTRPREQ